MDNKKLTANLLSTSNLSSMNNMTSFVKTYIEKLIYNITTYVDAQITVGRIEQPSDYNGANELSQEITGIPSAFSGVDAPSETLTLFAEKYSHLGITQFDALAKEAILDFLNLHNGLFVVQLSKDNICELSLNVPKQNGNYTVDHAEYKSITVIPVMFSFGTINFLLCES